MSSIVNDNLLFQEFDVYFLRFQRLINNVEQKCTLTHTARYGERLIVLELNGQHLDRVIKANSNPIRPSYFMKIDN